MGYEIELKAWVDDWEAVELRLRSMCEFIREFQKADRYFSNPAGSERDTSFRLRLDGAGAVVTFKEKRPVNGVEYNREREFSVDDAGAFLELVAREGCVEYASKVKTGIEFRHGRKTVELVRVEGLGAFLEIEIIEASSEHDLHRKADQEVRAFLKESGIGEDRIEGQSYVTLIRRKQVGEDLAGGR